MATSAAVDPLKPASEERLLSNEPVVDSSIRRVAARIIRPASEVCAEEDVADATLCEPCLQRRSVVLRPKPRCRSRPHVSDVRYTGRVKPRDQVIRCVAAVSDGEHNPTLVGGRCVIRRWSDPIHLNNDPTSAL